MSTEGYVGNGIEGVCVEMLVKKDVGSLGGKTQ